MPSFNTDPASFVDLNEIFPTLNEKVGLSAEQFRAVVENVYWNFNHLSQADIEVGSVTVNYAAAGTPFDVDITHTGQYDEHGCLIKDFLNFVFTIAVAKVTTTASATLGQTPSDIAATVTSTELADHSGYNFDFAFTIPRGLQGVQGVSFRNKGAYDSAVVYVNNGTYIDFVTYEGSLYAPIVTQTTAGTLPTNTSQWSLMVRRGNGITSITKTSTSGLVDTYTITFEDGTTTTFDVTNGATQDISVKADKVANATAGNIATLDANGNLADGGIAPADLQALIDSTHKLAADLVDDTNSTHKFVTAAEKAAWDGKQDVLQYDTMPTASASNEGDIIQYTGADTNDYTSGHFYKCIENSGNYGWEEIEFGGTPANMVTTDTRQSITGAKIFNGNVVAWTSLGIHTNGKLGLNYYSGTDDVAVQYFVFDYHGIHYYGSNGVEFFNLKDCISIRSSLPTTIDNSWMLRKEVVYYYIGATNETFTQKHFYKVDVVDGSYAWVDVTPSATPVTTITSQSTDSEIPSAKATWTLSETKQNTIDSSHKLSADLVDDTSTTNKFVTSAEKTAWNNKQDTIQYLTMPEPPTVEDANKLVQYIGEDIPSAQQNDLLFKRGHFYRVIYLTTTPLVLGWEEVEVGGSAPSNMVTTDTDQTITGTKTIPTLNTTNLAVTNDINPVVKCLSYSTSYLTGAYRGIETTYDKISFVHGGSPTQYIPSAYIQFKPNLSHEYAGMSYYTRNSSGTMVERLSTDWVQIYLTGSQIYSKISDNSLTNGQVVTCTQTYNTYQANHTYRLTYANNVWTATDITPSSSITPVTTISAQSTNADIPSAKAVYDYVQDALGDIDVALQALNSGGGV